MVPAATHSEVTRERLLVAAGEIFAEQGFRQATVRDICDRAEANIAAVNYHFGDKQGLYQAVFQCAASAAPPAIDGGTPAERLNSAVAALLACVFGVGRPTWYARLMMREMVEPTEVLDALVEERIRPMCEDLQAIVGALAPKRLDQASLRRCVHSLVAQCVYYQHSRSVISRLEPEFAYTPEELRRCADHIVAFTLGGIERVAREGRS